MKEERRETRFSEENSSCALVLVRVFRERKFKDESDREAFYKGKLNEYNSVHISRKYISQTLVRIRNVHSRALSSTFCRLREYIEL